MYPFLQRNISFLQQKQYQKKSNHQQQWSCQTEILFKFHARKDTCRLEHYVNRHSKKNKFIYYTHCAYVHKFHYVLVWNFLYIPFNYILYRNEYGFNCPYYRTSTKLWNFEWFWMNWWISEYVGTESILAG